MQKLFILVSVLALGACAVTRETPAPVVNVTTPTNVAQTPAYATPAVATASTAASNDSAPAGTTVTKLNSDSDAGVVTTSQDSGSGLTVNGEQLIAPIKGKIVQRYTAKTKGVDVAAPEGTLVVAAASGKVVYSGTGLKGYGNLIIIKHDSNYLTAYAHDKVNLVKENSQVSQGQQIAEVGKTEATRPMLHFELRKNGKPLDPTWLFKQSPAE